MTLTHVIVVDFRTGPRRWAEFDVDIETTTITNPRSEGPEARYIIDALRREHEAFTGVIWIDWMECYEAKPSLNDPKATAWSLMSRGYRLEGELARHKMPKPTQLPPGAIN